MTRSDSRSESSLVAKPTGDGGFYAVTVCRLFVSACNTLARRSRGEKKPELIVVIRAQTMMTTFNDSRPLLKLLAVIFGDGFPGCSPLKSRHYFYGSSFLQFAFGVCASPEEYRKGWVLWAMTSGTYSIFSACLDSTVDTIHTSVYGVSGTLSLIFHV